jgi:hypothetical protein
MKNSLSSKRFQLRSLIHGQTFSLEKKSQGQTSINTPKGTKVNYRATLSYPAKFYAFSDSLSPRLVSYKSTIKEKSTKHPRRQRDHAYLSTEDPTGPQNNIHFLINTPH